jgi:hypothetical protein
MDMILNVFLQQLVSDIMSTWKTYTVCCGRILQSIASAALVCEAADEIRITIFSPKFFEVRNINKVVETGNKLQNNFAALVTSSLWLDVARGPPVVPQWCRFSLARADTFNDSDISKWARFVMKPFYCFEGILYLLGLSVRP